MAEVAAIVPGSTSASYMRTIGLICIVIAATSCGGGAPPEATAAGKTGGEDVRPWMRAHFMTGREIRDAIVRGDVDTARARLTQIARNPGPENPPASWRPRLAALQAASREAASQETLPGMASAFAQVATRCAECHTATDAVVRFESIPAPTGSVPAQMARHRWAAERMWEGLVAPSPERFQEGATVLSDAPLHPAELVVGRAPPEQVVALAERVRGLAGEAEHAGGQGARAAIYGQLLSTCAACHTQQ